MKSVSKTDIGRIRSVNEDRVIVQSDVGGFTLAVLADGMGGHRAGDIASQMAVDRIQQELQSIHIGMSADECETVMREAIATANRHIFELASTRERYHGMGTTVVVALADRAHLIVGHIGDSRAYIVKSDRLIQLTEDHSMVNELLRSGQITPEEALVHPRRNVLTRALGTEPEVEVEIRRFDWQQDDLLLVCSDGLSGLVEKKELYSILKSNEDLHGKVDMLVERALTAGGDDNISVVLVANEPGSDPEAVHTEEAG